MSKESQSGQPTVRRNPLVRQPDQQLQGSEHLKNHFVIKQKQQMSTLSVEKSLRKDINALVTLHKCTTINELVMKLVEDHVSQLSEEQTEKLKLIKELQQ